MANARYLSLSGGFFISRRQRPAPEAPRAAGTMQQKGSDGMARRRRGFDTLAIHGGGGHDLLTGACLPPIYQTAAFVLKGADHAARAFAAEEPAYIYSRLGNPTNAAFEERLSRLEGGEAALATASGMAAVSITLLHLLRSGDEVVAGAQLFGSTFHLLKEIFSRYGITARFVDPGDIPAWEGAITPRTRALFVETPSNPGLRWADIPALGALAQQAEIPLVVDNTLNTPYLLRPLEHGASVVVHSATKFLAGHGAAIAGAVVGSADFIISLRRGLYQDLGPALSPQTAYLLLLGLETLGLRMQRHSANALAVARYLAEHPAVDWVAYPGLERDPYHALAARLLDRGFGGLVSFAPKGGEGVARRVIDGVRIFKVAANIGDSRSLVIHPYTTTHAQLTPEERQTAGVGPTLIRLSVGLENEEDLLDDLDRALAAAQGGA